MDFFKFGILLYFVGIDSALLLSAKWSAENASKPADGHGRTADVRYNTALAIFFVEAVKLVLASVFLRLGFFQDGRSGEKAPETSTWSNYARYSVPALSYALQNNLNLNAIGLTGVAVASLFGTSKLLFSAMSNKCLLAQKFHRLQVLGLFLVFSAMVLSQAKSPDHPSSAAASQEERPYMLVGICLVLLACALSGFSGALNEFLLKKLDLDVPPMRKNVWIYQWGTLLNGLLLLAGEARTGYRSRQGDFSAEAVLGSLFAGFSRATVAMILSYALFGITVSLVLQYFDNVTRAVAGVAPVFVATLLAWPLLGHSQDVTLSFLLAAVAAAAGTLTYQAGARRQAAKTYQTVGRDEGQRTGPDEAGPRPRTIGGPEAEMTPMSRGPG